MNTFPATCPEWLSRKISKKGGIISFYEYMNIVLNDPNNGYYGSGKAKIGIQGDYVTSPSLSNDFASLLAKQIEEWLKELKKNCKINDKLIILEFGSGNGCLLNGIIDYFYVQDKEILNDVSFRIAEINIGMRNKQKETLRKFIDYGVDIEWIDINNFHANTIEGIIIAHEVLDALPVERINYFKGEIFQECISLKDDKQNLNYVYNPIPKMIKNKIKAIKNNLNIDIPQTEVKDGWTSELHVDNEKWLNLLSEKIKNGILLIVDYAIDAKRYYSPNKSNGMLIAYKDQKAFSNFLYSPGECDLTSHLCEETLVSDADNSNFKFVGLVKQGEALLALGLAERLYEIQTIFRNDLSMALKRREALLRLVDPVCLGDFKWFVFAKFEKEFYFNTRCLS